MKHFSKLSLILPMALLISACGARGAQATPTANPVDIQNLPFDANGNLIDSRSRPRGAGFGVATGYQAPRTLQFQLRFAF